MRRLLIVIGVVVGMLATAAGTALAGIDTSPTFTGAKGVIVQVADHDVLAKGVIVNP